MILIYINIGTISQSVCHILSVHFPIKFDRIEKSWQRLKDQELPAEFLVTWSCFIRWIVFLQVDHFCKQDQLVIAHIAQNCQASTPAHPFLWVTTPPSIHQPHLPLPLIFRKSWTSFQSWRRKSRTSCLRSSRGDTASWLSKSEHD